MTDHPTGRTSPSDTSVDVLVIGGGPTGIGAAVRLQEQGADWLLVESSGGPGGMATSVHDADGFTWDLGGHVLHSHFADFDRAIESSGVEILQARRNGWVWTGGDLVPTPIQHQVDVLPDDLAPDAPAATLADFYRNHFGADLYESFFRPFTEKMWATPLDLVDHQWTSLRNGSAERNVPTIRVRDTTSAGTPADVVTFPYPRGGTGALWDAIAGKLDQHRLRYYSTVTAIDPDARIATLADGSTVRFTDCVSSMPITRLVRSIGVPELAVVAPTLRCSSSLVVGLGYDGVAPDALADKSWLYCPDEDVAWHRSTMLSNYDPGNAGDGRWQVLCEVGRSDLRVIDDAWAIASCRDSMGALGADPSALVTTWVQRVPMGYPVPTLGRDDLLHDIDARLLAAGIRSRGRFGGWRYESCNQDYSFQQGVEAVEAIAHGTPEDVYWHPERF